MIIKSLSRKESSFKSLIEYINQNINNNNNLTIGRNLYNTDDESEIIKEFINNSTNLKSVKNGNYLYHEIISLDPKLTINISQQEQIKILADIGTKYLEKRAKHNLSYGKIHTDTNHTHLHICISSNEVYSNKRFRLSKGEFSQIQSYLEIYKNEKYPQLATNIYNKNQNELQNNTKLTNNEQELKNRTKKPTLKEQFKAKLENILDSATNYKNFTDKLKLTNIEIIKRGNTITAKNLDDGKKYRLKTLGLLDKLEDVKSRIEDIKQRANNIEDFRTQNNNTLTKDNLDTNMNSIQAKKIAIQDLIGNMGFKPSNIKGSDIWYISPFRKDEKTPSFKINTDDNIWYDHGKGEGGNILDFVMQYNNCDFRGALQFLSNNIQPNLFNVTSKPKVKTPPLQNNENKKESTKPSSNLTIKKTQSLQNQALIQYLESRVINPNVAKDYISETYYQINDKHYFGVSFSNDSGGLELNNKYFKGGVGTKDITTINNDSNKLIIFEGFMDFLSYVSVSKNLNENNYLILNSVSMVQKAIDYIQDNNYKKIELYLDNDKAGNDAVTIIKESLQSKIESKKLSLKDKSNLYKKHKDLNEYLIARRDKRIEDLLLQREDKEVLERIRERIQY